MVKIQAFDLSTSYLQLSFASKVNANFEELRLILQVDNSIFCLFDHLFDHEEHLPVLRGPMLGHGLRSLVVGGGAGWRLSAEPGRAGCL